MIVRFIDLEIRQDNCTDFSWIESEVFDKTGSLSSGDMAVINLAGIDRIYARFLSFILKIDSQLREKGIILRLRNCKEKLSTEEVTIIRDLDRKLFEGLCKPLEIVIEVTEGETNYVTIPGLRNTILQKTRFISDGDKIILDLSRIREVTYFLLNFIFEINEELQKKSIQLQLRRCINKLKRERAIGIGKGDIKKFEDLCEWEPL